MKMKNTDIPQILLNNITGKVGNIIIRRRYGKTIISAVPSCYNKSNSLSSINNRKRFATIANISKALNSVPEFKKLWKNYAKNKMSSCNAAASYISKQVSKDGIPEIHSIFPVIFSGLQCHIQNKGIDGFNVEVCFGTSISQADSDRNCRKAEDSSSDLFSGRSFRTLALFILKGSNEFPDKYIVIGSDYHRFIENERDLVINTIFTDEQKYLISQYSCISVKYVVAAYKILNEFSNISSTFSIDDYLK